MGFLCLLKDTLFGRPTLSCPARSIGRMLLEVAAAGGLGFRVEGRGGRGGRGGGRVRGGFKTKTQQPLPPIFPPNMILFKAPGSSPIMKP